MSIRLKTVTLGCKVNQYETEYVRQGLLGAGYVDAAEEEPADLCIVNTCTVTREGDAKSRQVIRRLGRKNPDARIVVMGCYATRAPDDVATLPGVVEVVTDKRELPDLLGRFGVVDIPTGISEFGSRHRAFVKVQDGCMLRCTYCIIPYVRPQLQSRSTEHILDEVGRLVGNGYREIVLTGIHLGHYGVDWNVKRPRDQWFRLADLVRRIVEIEGDFRVRLSSIEATEVSRDLISVMRDNPDRVCPHLHLCLQSGSDRILRRMHRRWGVTRIVDCCHKVIDALDRPALTTDVIVGFPGETDEDFDDTCRVAEQIGFSKIHIFPFSARRGTPAAEMSDQVEPQVKSTRHQHLREIESDLRQRYFQSLQGRRLRVLIESPVDDTSNRFVGTSCRYAPVELPAHLGSPGQLIDLTAGPTINSRIHAADEPERIKEGHSEHFGTADNRSSTT